MPKFRENRELVLHAYQSNFISDEEFVLLYDINSSKNCDIPYWKYDSFDLDKMTDDECKAEFRFLKNDIYALTDILQLPDEIVCYNGTKQLPQKASVCCSNSLHIHVDMLTCAQSLVGQFQSFVSSLIM